MCATCRGLEPMSLTNPAAWPATKGKRGRHMHPSAAARDKLFEGFARALFKQDIDGLYRVITPGFVWAYHDGISAELVLTGRDAILIHLQEKKAYYSESRFHEVAYHHLPEISFMTFRVSEIVRATGERRGGGSNVTRSKTARSRPRTCTASR
jgi:hypothetical protein